MSVFTLSEIAAIESVWNAMKAANAASTDSLNDDYDNRTNEWDYQSGDVTPIIGDPIFTGFGVYGTLNTVLLYMLKDKIGREYADLVVTECSSNWESVAYNLNYFGFTLPANVTL